MVRVKVTGSNKRMEKEEGNSFDEAKLIAPELVALKPQITPQPAIDIAFGESVLPPDAIKCIRIKPSVEEIHVFWQIPPNCHTHGLLFFIEKKPASSYNIHVSDVIPTNEIFHYVFTNLRPEKTYRFRVIASNTGGLGPISKWKRATTLRRTPEPPKLNCIEFSSDFLKLWWGNMPKTGIVSYVLEMQTSMLIFKEMYHGPNLNLKLTGLECDTSYNFRIAAVDKYGQGPFTTPCTFSTSTPIPQCFTASAASYEYEQYSIAYPVQSPPVKSCGMHMFHSCEYKSDVTEAEAVDSQVPGAVNKINIYSMINALYLSWTHPSLNSAQVSCYNIEFNNIIFTTLGRIDELLVLNLCSGTKYSIRIQAVSDSGVGPFSETLYVCTLKFIPQPPELKCTNITRTYLVLECHGKNEDGLLSYAIELLGNNGFYLVYQGLEHSLTFAKLFKDTVYLFRTATISQGGHSEYSESFTFMTFMSLPCLKTNCKLGSSAHRRGMHDGITIKYGSSADRKLIIDFYYAPDPDKERLQLSNRDFHSLDAGAYLNDSVIDFYMKYLYYEKLSDRDDIYLFNPFFFLKLHQNFGKEGDDKKNRHELVKTWTRRIDLFSKKFIVIPINVLMHWIVAVICYPGLVEDLSNRYMLENVDTNVRCRNAQNPFAFETTIDENFKKQPRPCIAIFDSYRAYSKHKKQFRAVRTILLDYLECEWVAKKNSNKLFCQLNLPVIEVDCPQQDNGYDCGVHVLQNMENFFENPEKLPSGFPDLKSYFTLETIRTKRLLIKKLMLDLNEK